MPARDSSTNPDDGEDRLARDTDRDRDTERVERADRGGSKQKSPGTATSKTKDLSHVPCKFYKVGGCTAGASCPFSHTLVEPGGQKETCAWFVKGNCKFGHKCALAHILPGQSMAMDRKNKKAAQTAAAANPDRNERSERGRDGKGGRGGTNSKRDGHGGNTGSSTGTPGNRNPLLAGGSTAPTRVPTSPAAGRPTMAMPLKATLSPSAPAPPLASFGLPDDLDDAGVQLATAPAQGKQSSQDSTPSFDKASAQDSDPQRPFKGSSPAPLPTSAPRPTGPSTKTQPDFGPIGSPPTSGSYKANGTSAFSPGTSPHPVNGIDVVAGTPPRAPASRDLGFLSTSPFSAPGRQSAWPGGGSYNGGSGITASLGSGMAMMGGRTGWSGREESNSVGTGGLDGLVPQRHTPGSGYDIGLEYEEYSSNKKGKMSGLGQGGRRSDIVAVDEDLEDFLPSSLTDLLTPEERSRRMSRSNSGQGPGATFGTPSVGMSATAAGGGAGGGTSLGIGHRYSRSVPATTLLGDIRSIWADTNVPPLPSPTHRGTPSSSFASRFDPGPGGHHGDESDTSMSLGSAGGIPSLSPSNASAAFLPGLHQHYLSSKAKQAQQQLGLGLGRGFGARGTSGPLFTNTTNTNDSTNAGNYPLGSNPLSTNIPHTPQLPPQHTYRATPSPFDLTQQQHHHHLYPQPPHTALPVPSTGSSGGAINTPSANPDDPHHGAHHLSPSTRALQAHAPGQSLPQGLAAGYSRIHALPPPPSFASPGSAGVFGGGTPPADAHAPSSGPYGGWNNAGSPSSTSGSAAGAGGTSGLESMFSRLSYSAAAASNRGSGNHGANLGNGNGTGNGVASGNNNGSNTNTSPPGLQRNASGGRYQQHPLSPLSGPVVTPDDDDELFSMDG